MSYLYENHMGGLYTSDEYMDYEELYCETCGDSDFLLGTFELVSEFWDLIEDMCSFYGSGGYALQYVYPIIVGEFDLPDELRYEDDYIRLCGHCDHDDEDLISRIEVLIGRKIDIPDLEDEYESEANC